MDDKGTAHIPAIRETGLIATVSLLLSPPTIDEQPPINCTVGTAKFFLHQHSPAVQP